MFRHPVNHIRAPRLSGYDYSAAGAYFVTICTFRRMMLFGQVAGDAVALNAIGNAAAEGWAMLSRSFARVYVDAFVIMPNHAHAIVVLPGAEDVQGGSRAASTDRDEMGGGSRRVGAKVVSLSRVINAYKTF
jgi:hypothetical protein